MEEHDQVDDAIPEDERVTLPDLTKVFDDDDGEPDPFDGDVESDDEPAPYTPTGDA
jgi:hypothetical protein